MKILCVGDVHLEFATIPLFVQLFDQICKEVIRLKPDIVWFSGDVFHKHSTLHIECIKAAQEQFSRLSSQVQVFISLGNHDQATNSDELGSANSLMCLKYIPNIRIFDKYQEPIEKCLFVPYRPPGKLIDELNFDNIDFVFGHQEIAGVQFGPIKSEHGDKWPLTAPVLVSGHIHNPHWLQSNVFYVGSPYQTTFGCNYEPQFALIDTVSRKVEQFCTNLPKKITVIVENTEKPEINNADTYRLLIKTSKDKLPWFLSNKWFCNPPANVKKILYEITDAHVYESKPSKSSIEEEVLSFIDNPANNCQYLKELAMEVLL